MVKALINDKTKSPLSQSSEERRARRSKIPLAILRLVRTFLELELSFYAPLRAIGIQRQDVVGAEADTERGMIDLPSATWVEDAILVTRKTTPSFEYKCDGTTAIDGLLRQLGVSPFDRVGPLRRLE